MPIEQPQIVTPRSPAESFIQKLEALRDAVGVGQTDRQIQNFDLRIERGELFTPLELVQFQRLVQRAQLRVELVAKGAESLNGSLRRLQQGQ
jgi:hypothetical protein